jgi:hypothetical protein
MPSNYAYFSLEIPTERTFVSFIVMSKSISLTAFVNGPSVSLFPSSTYNMANATAQQSGIWRIVHVFYVVRNAPSQGTYRLSVYNPNSANASAQVGAFSGKSCVVFSSHNTSVVSLGETYTDVVQSRPYQPRSYALLVADPSTSYVISIQALTGPQQHLTFLTR